MRRRKQNAFLFSYRRRWPVLLLQGIVGLTAAIWSATLCRQEPQPDLQSPTAGGERIQGEVRLQGFAFGANYQVRAYPADPQAPLDVRKLQALIDDWIARFDLQLSNWRPDSEVSRFNRLPPGGTLRVGSEFISVYQESLWLARASSGAFDPGRAVLFERWGFGPAAASQQPPDAEELQLLLSESGIVQTRLRGGQLTKLGRRAELNFSALVSGLVSDRIFASLRAAGAGALLIDFSGEIRAGGAPPGAAAWRVGIERPEYDGSRSVEYVLRLRDLSTATSGDYRNYIEANGRRRSHILDARSGRPSATGIAAVTVVGPGCMRADALATALLSLSLDQALELLKKVPGYHALFYLHGENGRLHARWSPGMKALLESGSEAGPPTP
ncbi:MAG: FAD:protein FMN transferase [Leptospirales bacterium]|nr:FAD:protein FMN transferase [Leptospirales bacterium]